MPGYCIPPGHYTYEAVAPLLRHPELHERNLGYAGLEALLQAMVALGRTALQHNAMPAYDTWRRHMRSFVRTLQQRPDDEEPGRFYSYFTELLFFGAEAGNTAATKELHALLDEDQPNRLHTVLDLCGAHNKPPREWIASYANTPEERVYAWDAYMSSYWKYAQEEHIEPLPKEQVPAGAEEYVHSFLAALMPSHKIIGCIDTVYAVTTRIEHKIAVIERFCRVADKMNTEPDGNGHLQWMVWSALRMSLDPEVPEQLKERVYKTLRPGVPQFEDEDEVHVAFALLESAPYIARAATPAEVVARAKDVGSRHTTTFSSEMYHAFLAGAAKQYARHGKWLDAATVLCKIQHTVPWQSAISAYARMGGSVDLAVEIEAIHSHASQRKSNREMSRQARRADVATFLSQLYAERFSGACLSLQKMAEKNGSGGSGIGVLDIPLLKGYATLLLERDAKSVAVGKAVMDAVCNNEDNEYYDIAPLYELFTAYGSAEVAADHWQWVQQCHKGRVTYLLLYARAAMASAGIRQ